VHGSGAVWWCGGGGVVVAAVNEEGASLEECNLEGVGTAIDAVNADGAWAQAAGWSGG
jgi:hypothetical protein